MELTPEQIARIFAMYVPCKIINGISGDLKQRRLDYKNVDSYAYTLVGEPKLILRTIEQLTDEHLMELYHISCAIDKYDYTQDFASPIDCAKHWLNNGGMAAIEKHTQLSDHARSRGYSIKIAYDANRPFDRKTPIELGLALPL